MKTLILVILSLVLVAGTSYAASVNCQPLKAISTIANEGISSGGQVIFRNVGSAATCNGKMAAGATKVFPLPANNPDKALALILTGISLQKTFVVWANYDASTIDSISMEN
jgi:hypothetical protein